MSAKKLHPAVYIVAGNKKDCVSLPMKDEAVITTLAEGCALIEDRHSHLHFVAELMPGEHPKYTEFLKANGREQEGVVWELFDDITGQKYPNGRTLIVGYTKVESGIYPTVFESAHAVDENGEITQGAFVSHGCAKATWKKYGSSALTMWHYAAMLLQGVKFALATNRTDGIKAISQDRAVELWNHHFNQLAQIREGRDSGEVYAESRATWIALMEAVEERLVEDPKTFSRTKAMDLQKQKGLSYEEAVVELIAQ